MPWEVLYRNYGKAGRRDCASFAGRHMPQNIAVVGFKLFIICPCPVWYTYKDGKGSSWKFTSLTQVGIGICGKNS